MKRKLDDANVGSEKAMTASQPERSNRDGSAGGPAPTRRAIASALFSSLLAIFLSGSAQAQVKPAEIEPKLQQRLEKFPEADANGDGVLTASEARAYKKTSKQSKPSKEPEAGNSSSPPAQADVSYGPHERNILDFWRAASSRPTPVLIFFHGGSFKAGDKAMVQSRPIFEECLQAGISVVSANYRFSSDAPFPAPMHDGARAVQFVRSKATEWNIDPARIAVSGSSAGATLALWITLHDDLADLSSKDPVSRLSTRVACASPHKGTAGLEPDYFKKQAGVSKLGAALWQLFGVASQSELESPAMRPLLREASPLLHATRNDPPLFLTYAGDPAEAPFKADAALSGWIHHVCLGTPLKARYDELGIECEFFSGSRPPADGAEIAFLKKHLLKETAEPPAEKRAGKESSQSASAASSPEASPGATLPPATHIYQTFGERKLQLAMHYPPGWKADDKRPAVLFFSGSHKVQADKDGKLPPLAAERAQLGLPIVNRGPGENHVPFCDSFAQRGLVCMRVEYRTRGKDGVLPGEDVADAINAMRWVRGHPGLLGIDPNRIVAAGASSGGYLAASLFAFESRYPVAADASVSARPNAILLYSPLVDWLEVGSMSESFLVVLNGDKELGARVSPARHWRKDCPPTLVFVGTEEPPFTTVKAFAERWKAIGAPMELFVADGGKHGFFAQPAWVEKTRVRTDEFLRANNLLLPDPSALEKAAASTTPPPASQVYKTVGERRLSLALHFPPGWKSADKRPAIVFFGGGGFNPAKGDGAAPGNAGPGEAFAEEAEHFAGLGLVGVRVEYRKRKTDGVFPDKAVEDAKSALRWVRENAARLGIDPNRIVSCGGSSGGHLAASVGVLEEFDAPGDDVRFSAKPNAMMLHFPLLDFLEGGTRTMPFLDALGGDRALGERLSPARHWRKDLPPTLVLIGTKDPMFEFLKGFAAKWQDAGADLALYIGEGGGHGFSTTDAWRERALARMEEFLRKVGYFESK